MLRFVLVLVLAGLPALAAAADPPALARARALYNAGNYDAAIEAARSARSDPKAADAAALVLARAYLERFRSAPAGDPNGDLAAARAVLTGIRTTALSARDQLDLLIGLGQTLYFGDAFGPAADIFDSALGRASMLTAAERARLLDWWATALDRQAQARPADRRLPLFARIVDRMQEELRDDPGSANANYWLVVAIRGAGDLDRAWDAAIAGWVRATLSSDPPGLRAKLDRLVGDALIPERARTRPVREQQEAVAAMRAEWDAVKSAWQ
jgi:hypothetical protein